MMLKRWIGFVTERYTQQAVAVVPCAAVLDGLTQFFMGAPTVRLSGLTALVAATQVLLGLAIRCSDELRDLEVDRRYFPDRPLVTGRITPGEVKCLAFAAVALALVLNAVWNFALGELVAAVIFLALLSRWYFIPGVLSKNRFLAVLSNLPFFFLLYAYTTQASARFHGLEAPVWWPWLIAVWMLLPLHSFEFARKAVPPSEERPGYQTYSSLIGFGGAAGLAFAVAGLHGAFLALPLSWHGLSPGVAIGLGGLLLAYGVVAWRCMSGQCQKGRELEGVSGLYYMGTLAILGLGAWGIL